MCVRDKAKHDEETECTRLVHEYFEACFNAVSCRLRVFQQLLVPGADDGAHNGVQNDIVSGVDQEQPD